MKKIVKKAGKKVEPKMPKGHEKGESKRMKLMEKKIYKKS